MAGIVDQSLEARLEELFSTVRAMRARNPLDDAAVVNPATGGYVAMSSLAFGLVGSSDPSLTEIVGPANPVPGGLGWYYGNPSVWVYVTGGRLRVDVAAALDSYGNKCSMFMSYGLYGPALTSGAPGSPLVVGPAYDRSIEIQYNGTGMDQRAAMGTFGLHEGLARGWYFVQSAYALSFSGGTTPYGSASNRRLAVQPY